MSRQKDKQEDVVSRKIAFGSTVVLLCLLVLFLLVTLYSNNKLASQIRLLTEHPFTVNGDISDVKTNSALMRIRIERLQSYNQPEDIETVRQALQEIYLDMEALILEVDELYLGPEAHTDRLKEVYGQIKDTQSRLIEFAQRPSSSRKAIAEYEEKNIYPLYEELDIIAQRILNYVRNTQQSIFTSANHMSRVTVAGASIIMVAVSLGVIFFQYAIRKINQRLYQKNRQFEILSDTVDEAFLIFSREKKTCDFVSNSTGKVLGLSADTLRENRKAVYKYMNEGTAEEIHREIYSGEKDVWDMVVEYQFPESMESRWLQVRGYRIGDSEDIKFIITFTDQTQAHSANLALQDALVSAQNANSAKRDFLSRMSHEIRTPMNAIIGMTTIAEASIQDRSRVEDCLEKIRYSSKHLLMLINDVLDMSRIESNRVKLSEEPFELFWFLQSVAALVHSQAEGKGIKFIQKISGFTEYTTYRGDSLRLNQILLNLLSNAIKFTPRGGLVSLEVTQLPSRGVKSWLRFVVSDTGIGMDEDALRRLYTPFEQADSSIARKYGGTGLGMSITQNLVTLLGGYIDVKSTPNVGTTFTVELPFEQSEENLRPVKGHKPQIAASLKGMCILLAEDNTLNMEIAKTLLEMNGAKVEGVENGAEAVELFGAVEANHFDAVLMDVQMPVMDGCEATKRIRACGYGNAGTIPIIAVTANAFAEDISVVLAAGMDAHVSKPLDIEQLCTVLSRLHSRSEHLNVT